jgi:hypothetical protein
MESKPEQNPAEELAKWLQEKGIEIQLVAKGRITGALTLIQDFESASHEFTYILVPKQ